MSNQTAQPSYATYIIIWVWLIVLLAAGTFVSYLPIGQTGITLTILAVSLVKGLLVAWFFMHLKFEKSAPIWVVALFPFVLIAGAVLLILPALLLS